MINLSFGELKLIAQARNISSYENKSKEDLIKALSELKSESLKPKTWNIKNRNTKTWNIKTRNTKTRNTKTWNTKTKNTKLISSKLKISKLKIPKPKPRPKLRVNTKKLKKLRQDFDELRHKFDKKRNR